MSKIDDLEKIEKLKKMRNFNGRRIWKRKIKNTKWI